MAAPHQEPGALEVPKGRFYENEFPEIDECVMVKVDSIEQNVGAYVTLLEYDGKEGMLLLSELSKRRIRSVAKLLRVGRIEVCMVLRADEDKGYIDLSKRRVEPSDARQKEEQFAKAKAVHGIMRHVAGRFDLDLEDFCTKFSWPLNKKYGNAFDAYRKHINEDINVWKDLSFKEPGIDLSHLEKEIKDAIEDDLRRKLLTQTIRIQSKIDVSCNEYEGIEAIKIALLKGLELSSEDCEIKMKLIAHPTFMLTGLCKDKPLGIKKMQESMDAVKVAIEAVKGAYVERQAPTVMNDNPDNPDKDADQDSNADSDSSSSSDQDDTMGGLDADAEKKLAEMAAQADE